MTQLGTKARTALALGLPNLGRVFRYKLGVGLGFNAVRRLKAEVPSGPFFGPPARPVVTTPSSNWRSDARYFGWYPVALSDGPPDWHVNPLTGGRADASLPWWQIPDFDPRVGDIKTVWEASRMDWVLAMAQRAATGAEDELKRLNDWTADWCARNPSYLGPNWKCGQEASIRVMHLAIAALILGQTMAPAPGLIDLVTVHLRRIEPAIHYAIAQDNNHGTSEAAALYIGGSWLRKLNITSGAAWESTGQKWLENRVARLIEEDGSFSQYSVNYHRLVLDTLSIVEVWRRHLALPAISSLWQKRAAAATRWMFAMTSAETGDAPNLGANDGARLLPFGDTDYRDYRPSVQLAMALFEGKWAYADEGDWNLPMRWLGIERPVQRAVDIGSQLFDPGGYAVLRRGRGRVLLRYPQFRFRPGHADALHVDLWLAGENLLRDAGSFSYHTDPEWMHYFPGTASHNTVQFDDRDQMPRLGRFLFGDWLTTQHVEVIRAVAEDGLRPGGAYAPEGGWPTAHRAYPPAWKPDGLEAGPEGGRRAVATTCGASYQDRQGAWHGRRLSLMSGKLSVRDDLSGFARRAVARWRLRPGAWRVEGQTVTDGRHTLSVEADVPIARFELVKGWESRYYMQKTEIPVVEIEIHESGVLTTEYRWTATRSAGGR